MYIYQSGGTTEQYQTDRVIQMFTMKMTS